MKMLKTETQAIRVRFITFLLIAAIFALFSCATTSGPGLGGGITPGKYTKWDGFIDELEILQPITIAKYSKVVLLPIDTASTPLPNKDDNTYQPVTMVLRSIDSIFVEGCRKGMKDAGNLSLDLVQTPPKDGGTLIIKAKVDELNPGSQALRYFIGFGAGHSSAIILGELIDAESGQVYMRFKHGRGSSIGLFGGDYVRMMTGDSQDVAEDVGKMLTKFK